MGVHYFYGFSLKLGLRYVFSDGLGPPADLVPNRLCQEAAVLFG
jgi:hypothetical protein